VFAIICLQWLLLDDLEWIPPVLFLCTQDWFFPNSPLKTFFGSSLWEIERFLISLPNLVEILSIAFKPGDWGGVLITFGQMYKHHPLIKCEVFWDHRQGKMQNFRKSQVFQHWFSDVFEDCFHKRVCSCCLR